MNQKSFDEFGLFEIGRVYFPEKEKHEELRLAGVYFDDSLKPEDNFYKAKGKLKSFLEKTLKTEVSFRASDKLDNGFYHPVRTAEIFLGEKKVGNLGEINPTVADKEKIKKPFVVFEIDFDKLFEIKKEKAIFQEISKFPLVERDLAMFVSPKTEVAEVEDVIKKASGEELKEIKLFDIFEDKENNKKSFAFHFKFGKDDATLTGDQVDKKMDKIITALEGAEFEVRK